MQCLSCQNEVPAKFSHTIKTNCCPFCGNKIMEENLHKVLNNLRETMDIAIKQSFDVQALNWFSANFNLISRDSQELNELHKTIEDLTAELQSAKNKIKPIPKSGKLQEIEEVKMGADETGNQVQLSGPAIQNEEETQVFKQRAGVTKLTNKNDELRKMANQIKSNMKNGGGNLMITPAMLEASDNQEVQEMESMLSGGVPGITSGLDTSYDEEEDLPLAVAAFVGGGGGADYNQKDIEALKRLQGKQGSVSRGIQNGGVGLIRR